MSVPPIPARLADRPTRAGLVVPYISLEIDGRVEFGETRGIRVAECIVGRLCQIDGQPLGEKFVFLLTESQLADRFTREPALHPECAAYSIKACPMVAGRMLTYSRKVRSHDGRPCTTAGCECEGWVTEQSSHSGMPAEPWVAAWVTDYTIGIKDAARPLEVGNITGAVLTSAPLKVRPVSGLAVG